MDVRLKTSGIFDACFAGDYAEVFDSCDGHPQEHGIYHYHKIPSCVYNSSTNMQLLGVALDGHPIFGPKDESGTVLMTKDLDKCHGRTLNDGELLVNLTCFAMNESSAKCCRTALNCNCGVEH